ncbi:MAG TPA: YceI family protein, partial [Candidatus Binatus sp.]|nr:YceI family protein [Candidatus Binatus sp.]
FIAVRSLKSVKEDGTPYDEAIDKVMYEHLKADTDPKARITYHLNDLTLKEAPKSKDAPYVFEAKGDIVVAGVTNQVTTPVSVLPQGDKKLKITGSGAVKMTDFKMQPPTALAGALKTGDEVKLSFEWNVMQRAPAAAASK